MNPLDFSWTEDQQVTVTNPTSENYQFKVHNKEYQVGAGKSAKMPGYIAWVYVYNMGVKLVQADGFFNRWNEPEFRKEYYERVVSGADPLLEEVQVEPEPEVQEFEQEVTDSEPELVDEPVAKVAPMKPKVISGRAASRA